MAFDFRLAEIISSDNTADPEGQLTQDWGPDRHGFLDPPFVSCVTLAKYITSLSHIFLTDKIDRCEELIRWCKKGVYGAGPEPVVDVCGSHCYYYHCSHQWLSTFSRHQNHLMGEQNHLMGKTDCHRPACAPHAAPPPSIQWVWGTDKNVHFWQVPGDADVATSRTVFENHSGLNLCPSKCTRSIDTNIIWQHFRTSTLTSWILLGMLVRLRMILMHTKLEKTGDVSWSLYPFSNI